MQQDDLRAILIARRLARAMLFQLFDGEVGKEAAVVREAPKGGRPLRHSFLVAWVEPLLQGLDEVGEVHRGIFFTAVDG
jgi:hypothetical protein